jgi:hypothetical protein
METKMVIADPELPDWVCQLLAVEREKALEDAAKVSERFPTPKLLEPNAIAAAIRALKDTSNE